MSSRLQLKAVIRRCVMEDLFGEVIGCWERSSLYINYTYIIPIPGKVNMKNNTGIISALNILIIFKEVKYHMFKCCIFRITPHDTNGLIIVQRFNLLYTRQHHS